MIRFCLAINRLLKNEANEWQVYLDGNEIEAKSEVLNIKIYIGNISHNIFILQKSATKELKGIGTFFVREQLHRMFVKSLENVQPAKAKGFSTWVQSSTEERKEY